MAVACYQERGAQQVLRSFHPPTRATLAAWYRAATGGIPAAPSWRVLSPEIINGADITEDTIIWTGVDWTLYVSRKKSLR